MKTTQTSSTLVIVQSRSRSIFLHLPLFKLLSPVSQRWNVARMLILSDYVLLASINTVYKYFIYFT